MATACFLKLHMTNNYLPEVRKQYEALPYPPCDPEDDRSRLARTWLEDLPMINHYCFAGKQSFQNNFRVLVAGGGTGDATIFLAEQLRALKAENAQVVHLDMSQASIEIAQRRAEIRGLTNITWVQDSLLNLPARATELGRFDYINCSGVLHHLADPDLGLKALLSVLRIDDKLPGAIGMMVYGAVGRLGVYQIQRLMCMINDKSDATVQDMKRKITNTRDLLACLPSTNWFMRGEELHHDHKDGDAGIYDLLLHSQDRAYTVSELYDWLCSYGMHLNFSDVQRGRAPYLPHMVLGLQPPVMLPMLRKLPLRQQHEMAELMIGNLITHSLYLTQSENCAAPYGDGLYIPFFYHEPITGESAAQAFSSNQGKPFMLKHQHSGVSLTVNPGRYGPQLLRLIDGQKSFQEIFDAFRTAWRGQAIAPDNSALFADFADCYETLNALELILLRHPDATH